MVLTEIYFLTSGFFTENVIIIICRYYRALFLIALNDHEYTEPRTYTCLIAPTCAYYVYLVLLMKNFERFSIPHLT